MINKEFEITKEVLTKFEEWLKTQPIYVSNDVKKEILIARNGCLFGAVDCYINEVIAPQIRDEIWERAISNYQVGDRQ